jgi:hypothetical protein
MARPLLRLAAAGAVAAALAAAPLSAHAATPQLVHPDAGYLSGSAASVTNCKAWMNWTGNYYTQALLESWNGTPCTVHYFRSHSGSATQEQTFRLGGTGTYTSSWWWDGSGYLTWVCVVNDRTGASACGGKF